MKRRGRPRIRKCIQPCYVPPTMCEECAASLTKAVVNPLEPTEPIFEIVCTRCGLVHKLE